MSDQVKVVKEGVLKKRKARMQSWSSRYFILTNRTLSYKLKADAQQLRDSFDLVPGCLVTHIETETRASIKGRKLYSFWVVWPHDKSKMKDDETAKPTADSDDEKDAKDAPEETKSKNLKSIVENEVWEHRKQKNIVEEQIEMHHQRDHNISLGAKVAAITVGGVIVGALTAGIGLLPYIAVVGVATVAGGGAVVYNWRKPFDSRLILACETMEEAIEWRTAIEQQITLLEMAKKHSLPSSLDPRVISSLLTRASQCAFWRRVGAPEGMRIMEQFLPTALSARERWKHLCTLLRYTSFLHPTVPAFLPPTYQLLLRDTQQSKLPGMADCPGEGDARCRRAQVSAPHTTISTFLAVMSDDTQMAPEIVVRTVHKLDDHADALELEVDFGLLLGQPKAGIFLRKLYLHRFWALDDDGIYLVTFTTPSATPPPGKAGGAGSAGAVGAGAIVVPAPSGVGNLEYHPVQLDAKKRVYHRCAAPTVHAVLTVAPRADFAEYEFDVHDCTVSCSVQVTDAAQTGWSDRETAAFMDGFLRMYLLEIRNRMVLERYGMSSTGNVLRQPQYMQSQSVGSVSTSWSETAAAAGGPAAGLPPTSANSSFYQSPATTTSSSAATAPFLSDAVLSLSEEFDEPSPPAPAPGSPSYPKHSSMRLTSSSNTSSQPPGPPSTSPMMRRAQTLSMSRRGVTTVQPGMEDTLPPPLPTHHSAYAHAYSSPSDDSHLQSHRDKEGKEKVSRTRRMLGGLFSRSSKPPSAEGNDLTVSPPHPGSSEEDNYLVVGQEQQQRGGVQGGVGIAAPPGSTSSSAAASASLSGTTTAASSSSSSSSAAAAATAAGNTASTRQLTREERRQKQKEFNTKLKRLRVKIEEKTCELKRVTETMREANRMGIMLGTSSNNSNANNSGANNNSSAAGNNNSNSNNADGKASGGNSNSNNNTSSSAGAATSSEAAGGGADVHSSYITAAQYAMLQGQQGELSAELQRLKGEYQHTSGQSYDRGDSTAAGGAKKRGFGRFRGYRSNSVTAPPAGTAGTAAAGAGAAAGGLPPPASALRSSSAPAMQRSTRDGYFAYDSDGELDPLLLQQQLAAKPYLKSLVAPYWPQLAAEDRTDLQAAQRPLSFALKMLLSRAFWKVALASFLTEDERLRHPVLREPGRCTSQRSRMLRALVTAVHSLFIVALLLLCLAGSQCAGEWQGLLLRML